MYYPKLVYASFTIEGVFLFGILCLFNKIYGLESLYYIGNFQIIHMEEPNKSHWETPLLLRFVICSMKNIFIQITKCKYVLDSFFFTLLAEGELEMSSVSWQFLFLEMKCEVVKFLKSFPQLA